MRAAAALHDLFLEHMRRILESLVDLAVTDFVTGDDIRFELRAHARARRLFAQPAVDRRLQNIIGHVNERRGVFGDIAVIAKHDGDRLADIGDFGVGKRKGPDQIELGAGIRMALHAPLAHGRADVVERENGVNSGRRRGVTGIDGADRRMGMRAAHEARMQQAGKRDIVDKAGASLQQGLVLDAMNALSDQARALLSFCRFPLLYLIVYNLAGLASRRPGRRSLTNGAG